MGKTVAILGSSGDGKTTSTIINPDGKCFYLPENDRNHAKEYLGMDPKTHFIINLDKKDLPFPGGIWCEENANYATIDSFAQLKDIITWVSSQSQIKSIALDTINIYLAMKEFNDRKKLTFDNWKDLANDIIELNLLCNSILRKDQIAYIFGHTMLQTQADGTEKIVFSVIGKKLTKTPPEGFYPITLMTRVEFGDDGDNKYLFQTKANHSSAKTPIGMFKDFEIPNSLKLVDNTIRTHYKME